MNGIIYPYGSSHLIDTKSKKIYLPNKIDTADFASLDNEIPASTILQLSGGIDSAYVLWDWLKSNPDKYCLVHHIVLINRENRHEKEIEAVDKILRWLDSIGLNNYFFIQNTFDYGNMTELIYDVEVCGFLAGVLLRANRWNNIDNILLTQYDRNTPREMSRRQILRSTVGRDINFVYKLTSMTKQQVIEAMPEELFELCWYCRTPHNNRKCGNCMTCRAVERARNGTIDDAYKNFLKGM
jgi:7-cyano-7-deazaguanine synthase in queuosine biosynthesis